MEQKKITLPKGWEIDKVEGNEIILKESKNELPKTWEECYERLGVGEHIREDSSISEPLLLKVAYKENRGFLPVGLGKPMLALMQLLICRQVYRQGWKPDLEDDDIKYYIEYFDGDIDKNANLHISHVLSFQSAEVRDKFLENFHDLIKEAKELI